ncbi:MAG: MSF1 domain [Lasallia pustulata]|uniref:MSF1 domain n=1 Tax=Lasallia pustulata TaxID=136370 RepID=A0A5M8PZH3_9LECA|nr:MAG: MSF1 domain [Lasallia pustulata]
MVKFFESSFIYDYSFPAVTLAYFLRYPNPLAHHVFSTDVIDRHFDPVSQKLHTTRLHQKRSRIPPAVLKLLPKGILGANTDGTAKSYVVEKSVVDVKEGWMETETRNLEWTGILSVVEKQIYRRGDTNQPPARGSLVEHAKDETTDVTTSVTFVSRFGQARALGKRRKADTPASSSVPSSETEEESPPKRGFLASWSTASVQRTIEIMGMRRTREALVNSKEGMNVVLERLLHGGLVGVLEGMRRDHEDAFGPDGPWKRAWQQGPDNNVDGNPGFRNHPFDED